MARTKKKKPGGGKAIAAREIRRGRDRDLPMAQKQDRISTARPCSTRLSRMAICQFKTIVQSSESMSGVTPGGPTLQRLVKCIQARSELTAEKSTDVLDLRHIDHEELGSDCEHFESQHAPQDFRVLFSAGLLGFSGRARGSPKLLKVECFKSLTSLADIFVHVLRPQFETVTGLNQEMYELAGYEVCFPEGFVCGQVVVDPGQRVLIRSEYMLGAWADQTYKNWRYKHPAVVVRIAQAGGAMFDPTFRTPKELEMPLDSEPSSEWISLPPSPQDPIESEQQSATGRRLTKREKAQRKREKRQCRVLREAEVETGLIGLQRLMERQHLSDEDDSGSARIETGLRAEAKDLPTVARQSTFTSQPTEQTEMELD